MTGYLRDLAGLFDRIESRVDDQSVGMDESVPFAASLLADCHYIGSKIMVIGNGGSAAIASHIVTDAVKNADLRAMTFSDPALLTCLSNDRGYPEVYATPIKLFGESTDVLIAISSSGNSENILRAVDEARDQGMVTITLSGFDPGNRLRTLGRLAFYVPAYAYGMVEITHLAILHAVIDTVIARRPPR
jgi:D-sedoheptulose 7-phosphate isomerase